MQIQFYRGCLPDMKIISRMNRNKVNWGEPLTNGQRYDTNHPMKNEPDVWGPPEGPVYIFGRSIKK